MSAQRIICVQHAPIGTTPVTCEFSLPRIRIGRDPEVDISLPDAEVSRIHAVLEFRDNAWHLEDLHSTNGVKVNGNCATHRLLHEGDLVAIGSWTLYVAHCSKTGTMWIEVAPATRSPQVAARSASMQATIRAD